MSSEVIFKCRSKNNKNIRENELKILRKKENQLYFEFGENEMNLKKRYYDDVKILNEDFNKVLKLKEDLEEGKAKRLTKETDETEIVEKKTSDSKKNNLF